jgi:hypothetical protein
MSIEWRPRRCAARWSGHRCERWPRMGCRSARSRGGWGSDSAILPPPISSPWHREPVLSDATTRALVRRPLPACCVASATNTYGASLALTGSFVSGGERRRRRSLPGVVPGRAAAALLDEKPLLGSGCPSSVPPGGRIGFAQPERQTTGEAEFWQRALGIDCGRFPDRPAQPGAPSAHQIKGDIRGNLELSGNRHLDSESQIWVVPASFGDGTGRTPYAVGLADQRTASTDTPLARREPLRPGSEEALARRLSALGAVAEGQHLTEPPFGRTR